MASGLNEPETPLSPTAQTIVAPGLVDTEFLRDLGDLSAEAGHVQAASRLWRQALAVLDGLGDARACAEIRGRLDRPA
jgi:hypothetical protein